MPLLVGVTLVLLLPVRAEAFIDPERPLSWLVGECRTIAALKMSAMGKNSATFEVSQVLLGELKEKQIAIAWTAVQQAPVEKEAVGCPAVLLVPKDAAEPTLLHVSPEYLSLSPAKNKPGQYEFIRLNGFVKGSFNGEAADLIALIQDTIAKRAYFPIWADTSFAPAAKIGELPAAAAALAVGDLDGDGKLDILAGSAKGLLAFTADSGGKFAARQVKGVGGATVVKLADVNEDGRLDVLTDSGLFLAKGDWQYEPAAGVKAGGWSWASFCRLPLRPGPAILALQAGRVRAFASGQDGAWADVTGELGLDKSPQQVQAASICQYADDRFSIVLATGDALAILEGAGGKAIKQTQSLPLVAKGEPALKNVHLVQRDLDGDSIADVFLAGDGAGRCFRRQADGRLSEIPDYLGDVRKMFTPTEGLAGLICEDFNNDGLADLLAWSKADKLLLMMNRGYHNLREGTELFDLPLATEKLAGLTAAATADIDGDGDLDLVVADGPGIHLLSNTFEKKPEQANDRPRHPLLAVQAVGHFGALVSLEDKEAKPLVRQRVGDGPAAERLYFGYRSPIPAMAILTSPAGNALRRTLTSPPGTQPVIFKDK